ncbi:MAG: hypothetical protein UHD07_02480 [Ruminobacter sp.]|nr:hypothetical protein [Ruminobacter sp.]
MNIEELKKQLNKSLIFECVAMITPMILYVIMLTFTFIVYALVSSDEASAIIVLSLTAVMIIVVIGLLITKIIFTIKAMNSCLDYFTHENDERFIKNTSNSKTSYIIAIILGFIPLINLISVGILIYNLIMWFNIKDRLNTNVQPQDNQASNNTENNNIGLDQNS